MEDSLPVLISTRVSMDEIFGPDFYRGMQQTVSPYLYSVFLLMKVLNDEIERDPPTSEEHAHLSAMLFGLLERREELSFKELCRIAGKSVEPIYPGIMINFPTCILGNHPFDDLSHLKGELTEEELAALRRDQKALSTSGCDLPIRIQWEKFGNRTETKEHRGTMRSHLESFLHRSTVLLNGPQSHLETFIIRMQVFEERLSAKEKSRFMKELQSYMKGGERKDEDEYMVQLRALRGVQSKKVIVPLEIASSFRARYWLMKQIHLCQVCPTEVSSDAVRFAEIIQQTFPDVTAVYILRCLLAIKQRNEHVAMYELRRYFDGSQVRENDAVPNTVKERSMRLLAADAKQIRYAPILLARVCRLFGDKHAARQFLHEAITQSKTNKELTCLRFALVELGAVEAMPEVKSVGGFDSRPTYETRATQMHTFVAQQAGALPAPHPESALLAGAPLREMLMRTNADEQARYEGEQCRNLCLDPLEYKHMINRMVVSGKLIAAMHAFIMGEDIKFDSSSGTGGECAEAMYYTQARNSGPDPLAKNRMVVETSLCFSIVGRHHAGLTGSAIAATKTLLASSHPDAYAPRHDTEAQAVAGITAVFSLATEGRWDEATKTIAELQDRFCRPGSNWQCSRHVEGAAALVAFDRAFLRGEWSVAEETLSRIESVHPNEAVLRRAALLGVTGNLPDAIACLRAKREAIRSDWMIPLQTRFDMQLGMLLARNGETDKGLSLLLRALELCNSRRMYRLGHMVTRRCALVQIMMGEPRAAHRSLQNCEKSPQYQSNLLGLLEECLMCLTKAQLGFYVPKDLAGADNMIDRRSNDSVSPGQPGYLAAVGMARALAAKLGCPPLEKHALAMAARVYEQGPIFDRIVSQLQVVNEKCPATIDWTIL